MKHLGITLGVAVAAVVTIVAVHRAIREDPPGPWLTDEATAFARARAENKGVLIDLTATWSVPSAEVSLALDGLAATIDAHYVRLRIDVSEGNEELRARYGAATIPAVILVTADGQVVDRITQVLARDELRARLRSP